MDAAYSNHLCGWSEGAALKSIPFFCHDLGQPELQAIAEVFSGPILTTGETVSRFEQEFAGYLGRQHVLGVTSCTGALHLALLALGIGPGDEVITTPMTFIATATAIIEAGARPVFVDVEAGTGNLDAVLVEAAITPRTRAILPVHLYGQMCDMRALRRIADQYGLAVVEDCAHCIEGSRDGVRPGDLSDAACFSFYATKNITCGEGGALATDRVDLSEKVRLLRLHGMSKTAEDREREGYSHWDMPVMGWKYNMDNIQAAILLPQMARLKRKHERRQQLASAYRSQLSAVPGVSLPVIRDHVVHANHLFPIWVKADVRDKLVQRLQQDGVGVVVNYRAIHLLSYFSDSLGHKRGDFPVAEKIGDMTLSLPFFPDMTDDMLSEVVRRLANILRNH